MSMYVIILLGDNMDQDTKREIILDHYAHPRHRGLIEDKNYIKIDMNNESCIDEIHLLVKINNGIIEDIRFDGEACAICTSATSIMIETLIGKNLKEAKEIYDNYINMLDEKEYNSTLLEEAIVYSDIYKQPNRKKCALLPWWGIEKAFKEAEHEKN